jgi:isopentenyl diphosphate isomerase/L-lactate dehydrogenase-like FMN-dependent dehydrogenase
MRTRTFTRRQLQGAVLSPRRPPREELVNTLEFEEVAKTVLPAAAYSTIAGGDRRPFDRIIFRPRMLVPTTDLDLSLDLFGQPHFAPILVGPVADQRRYHPEGELAMLSGAAAARAGIIVSSRASAPIGDIAARAKTPLWYSVYTDAGAAAQKQIQQATAAGCNVLVITSAAPRIDWKAIAQLRRGVTIPVVIKGIMTTGDAKTAIEEGARGIVISDHGAATGKGAAIDALPGIADLVGGKATILIDGSFRRGTDVLKALLLGAQAVLVARPVMWGLAAYGAEGVQSVIELLQTSLGRNMGTIGAPNLKSLTRTMVRIDRPRS